MSFVPRFVTHNASLKLLAFVGAVFLWAIVPGAPQGGEVLADVPVRVQVADLDWVLTGEPEPSRVQVRVSGPTREIIRLAREGTVVRVPLEAVASSDTVVTLRRDWVAVQGAPRVVVEEVVPGAVRVRLEPARSESLPLVPALTGELPVGLALAAPPGVSPAVARVRGPARLLDEVTSIPLRPVDLSQIRGSGLVEVAVDTTGLGGLLVDPLRASVGIRVDPKAERRLTDLSIGVVNDPGYDLVLEPAMSDVAVVGAQGRLDAAPLEQVGLVVDGRLLAGMAPGESRTVPVGVMDVPPLLSARAAVDSVLAFRPMGGWSPP